MNRKNNSHLEHELDKLFFLSQPSIQLRKNTKILEQPGILVRRPIVVIRIRKRLSIPQILPMRSMRPSYALHLSAVQCRLFTRTKNGGKNVDLALGCSSRHEYTHPRRLYKTRRLTSVELVDLLNLPRCVDVLSDFLADYGIFDFFLYGFDVHLESFDLFVQ